MQALALVWQRAGDLLLSARRAADGIPGFSRFVALADALVPRIFTTQIPPAALRPALEPFLEIERARQFDRALVLLLLAGMAALGLYPSSLGHLDTTPYVFTILPAVSSFNPYLGVVSGVVFSAADWLGKFLPFESVYGATLDAGLRNWFGARLGYLFAYSTMLLTGLLPGVGARLGRVLATRLAGGGASAAVVAVVGLAGWLWVAGDAAGPLGLALVACSVLAATAKAGDGAAAAVAGMVGSVAGGAAGSVAALEFAKQVGNYAAFIAFRATPDISCRAVSEGNYTGQQPLSAAAGGAGATTPVIKPPRPGWDPTVEEQIDRWKKDKLVWDPQTLTWRPPRRDDFPPPEKPPDEPTPFERSNPRDKCPWQCLALYDRYASLQRDVLSLDGRAQEAKARYQRGQDRHNMNLAKFTLLTGWELGSLLGGGVSGVQGAGGLVHGPRVPAGAGGGGMGHAAAAASHLGVLKQRIADLGRRVASLVDEVLDLGTKLAQARKAVREAAESLQRLTKLADEFDEAARATGRSLNEAKDHLANARLLQQLDVEKEGLWSRLKSVLDKKKVAEGSWDDLIRLDDWAAGMRSRYQTVTQQIAKAREELVGVLTNIQRLTAERQALVKINPAKVQLDQVVGNLAQLERQIAQASSAGADGSVLNQLLNRARQLEIEKSRLLGSGPPPAHVITDPARYQQLGEALHQASSRKTTLESWTNLQYRSFGEFAALEDPGNYQAWALRVKGTDPRALKAQDLARFDADAAPLRQSIDRVERQMGNVKGKVPAGATPELLERRVTGLELETDSFRQRAADTRSQLDGARVRAEGAEQHAGEIERLQGAKQRELNGAQAELNATQGEYDRLSQPGAAGAAPPAQVSSDQNVVVRVLTAAGEAFQRWFGGQSQAEIARILVEGHHKVAELRAELEALELACDAARQELRGADAAYDKCVSEHGQTGG